MKKDFGLLIVDKNTGQILHTVRLVFDLAHDADKLNTKRLHNLADGFLRLMHKYASIAMTINIDPLPIDQKLPLDVY